MPAWLGFVAGMVGCLGSLLVWARAWSCLLVLFWVVADSGLLCFWTSSTSWFSVAAGSGFVVFAAALPGVVLPCLGWFCFFVPLALGWGFDVVGGFCCCCGPKLQLGC